MYVRGNKHFDGLLRRIMSVRFCRRMKSTRLLRKEMDGKVLITRQNRIFYFDVKSTFPSLYLDLACKQMFPAKQTVQTKKGCTKRHNNFTDVI